MALKAGILKLQRQKKRASNQPKRNLDITGKPEDEVTREFKKSYIKNTKSLKGTLGVFHVQPERISHELQTERADSGNLQKPGDKYQKVETGNQSEFQITASRELSEMINLTDSAEESL